MKRISIKDIENALLEVYPENDVQAIGNGLYKINSAGIICNERFLNELYKAILHSLKEYNTDTSAQLLRNKDEDIVRPYIK